MSSCMLWLLVFLQVIVLTFSSSNETDRPSLLAFKAAITDDPLHTLSSWNESLHFCQWSGVTCGRRHQRVIGLNLNSRKLVGRLTPHIGNLSFLRILNLTNNSLSHSIPQELGRLFRLQTLDLYDNIFSGEIPVNITRCSKLMQLWVGKNNLSGKLHAELGSLSNLQVFDFDRNNFVGELPQTVSNLSSLEQIYGVQNNFNGGIPDGIGHLQKLRDFALGQNYLTGMIPDTLYNLSSLIVLDVGVNNLHGSLPPNLGVTLPNLQFLYVQTNQFSRAIPKTLSNASNLLEIQLSQNLFTGEVPAVSNLQSLRSLQIAVNRLGKGEDNDLDFLYPLVNNTNLELLDISRNNFRGVLPETLSNFSKRLWWISFGANQIRGSIPTEIGDLDSLETLAAEDSQLSGIIPSSMGRLQHLNVLSLWGNKISGTIPSSLGNISSLSELHLELNNLQGSIPSSLGNCKMLQSLTLFQNNLSGTIPKEVIGISSLTKKLDLSENQLTGLLPLEVGKLVNLAYLDVSINNLFGELPKSLGSCSSLEYLYLERNSFGGVIPQSLSSLKAIRELNMSYNNFSGKIPMYLVEFKLEILDLSYNGFEGEVPMQGIFRNATQVSVVGNKKLCGGISQLNLTRCSSTKSTFYAKLRLIVVIICGLVGMILLATFVLLFHFKKRRNKPATNPEVGILFQRLSYSNLLKATNGFSSTNLIGVGSFGSVYKGVLEVDKIDIVVKVLNLLKKGASKSFMAECEALASIRHRNLVKLLTVCSSNDFQGNDFKALIYEFMVNGSLEEWLHLIQRFNEAYQPRSLNFRQRLNIAMDVASAINYLHHHSQRPFVHCDLKPNNVLLDDEMTAHVGDFGLARLLPSFCQPSSSQSSSIGIKGTIGYAAPEYGMGSQISTEGDVYSYDIMLLEIFTRKRPTDDMFKDGLKLHDFVKMALENNAEEVVDPTLLEEDEETNGRTSRAVNHIRSDKAMECLISVLKIGVACSEESPKERMDMTNVVAELHRVKQRLHGTRRQ